MRYPLIGIAFVALMSATAGAQADHRTHTMQPDSAHAMKTPCPMHLTTLGLSAQQKLSMDSLLADHERIMKSVMPAHEATPAAGTAAMSESAKGIMESDMRLTTAAIRSILSDSQRQTFDAAVTAHAAEMAAMKAKGDHDCAACCKDCMSHASHAEAMKHEG